MHRWSDSVCKYLSCYAQLKKMRVKMYKRTKCCSALERHRKNDVKKDKKKRNNYQLITVWKKQQRRKCQKEQQKNMETVQ